MGGSQRESGYSYLQSSRAFGAAISTQVIPEGEGPVIPEGEGPVKTNLVLVWFVLRASLSWLGASK